MKKVLALAALACAVATVQSVSLQNQEQQLPSFPGYPSLLGGLQTGAQGQQALNPPVPAGDIFQGPLRYQPAPPPLPPQQQQPQQFAQPNYANMDGIQLLASKLQAESLARRHKSEADMTDKDIEKLAYEAIND